MVVKNGDGSRVGSPCSRVPRPPGERGVRRVGLLQTVRQVPAGDVADAGLVVQALLERPLSLLAAELDAVGSRRLRGGTGGRGTAAAGGSRHAGNQARAVRDPDRRSRGSGWPRRASATASPTKTAPVTVHDVGDRIQPCGPAHDATETETFPPREKRLAAASAVRTAPLLPEMRPCPLPSSAAPHRPGRSGSGRRTSRYSCTWARRERSRARRPHGSRPGPCGRVSSHRAWAPPTWSMCPWVSRIQRTSSMLRPSVL